MTDDEVLAYVKAAALAVSLPLDEARAQRVATHLARTAALARQRQFLKAAVARLLGIDPRTVTSEEGVRP